MFVAIIIIIILFGGGGGESSDFKVPIVQVKFLSVPPFKPEWNPALIIQKVKRMLHAPKQFKRCGSCHCYWALPQYNRNFMLRRRNGNENVE